MAYTKAGMKAVDKYVKENYDRLNIKVPKGQKATIEAAATAAGESVNQYTQKAILARMGLEEWPDNQDELPAE
ncbi:MAG: hypothetical protein ACI4MF_08915 [Candidatus Faecivicinus sp.]